MHLQQNGTPELLERWDMVPDIFYLVPLFKNEYNFKLKPGFGFIQSAGL